LDARVSVTIAGRLILDHMRLRVRHGGAVGLVGQSGSGKSTLALALMGLLGREAKVEGSILLDGVDLLAIRSEHGWRPIRGRRVALVLQSAAAAMNPALRIETHLREAWQAHSPVPWRAARSDAQALLRSFDLPDSRDFLDRYPSQVSVGQAQRVLIAMALLHRPSLVIADEVTSALDLLTQREVLSSLRRANIEWGTALLHITHDLLSVPEVCRDVVVLEQGRLVESGPCSEVLSNPRQAYTRRLIAALPTGGWNPSAAALHS
jgi:ABC-type glutathione transport system ATPase component